MTKIYVGNLPFSANESEIRELFGQHGTVESVSLITDRETGRSARLRASWKVVARGCVTRAIQNFNGSDMAASPACQ